MAHRAPRQLRRVLALLACLAAALLLSVGAGTQSVGAAPATPPSGGLDAGAAARNALASALRTRMPAALHDRVQPLDPAAEVRPWATLPAELDGRVRLGRPGAPAGRAGWQMLDVPSLRRIELSGGAAYVSDEWDVLQSVDEDRLREYVVVRAHQGTRTWRWRLNAATPDATPRLTRDGRIDLGGGYRIEPPKLLDAELAGIDRPVRWRLRGDLLTLTFDDSGLELPYVIDPDATPPALVVDIGDGVALDEAAAAATDTFTVALPAQPQEPVDVHVGVADSQTAVDRPTLTFLPADWNVPQQVEVTVVDDPMAEPSPHPGAITLEATSADPAFQGLTAPDVAAAIADDDVPAVIVTAPADPAMAEADTAGTERRASVRLATRPASPVVIDVSTPGGQLGVRSLPTITFDASNWNLGVDVVVRALDDGVVERDPHVGTLAFSIDPSSDPGYASLTVDPIAFSIADDDRPGVVVTDDAAMTLAEADPGTSRTLLVQLAAMPTSDVVVTAANNGQVMFMSSPVLTFSPTTWDVPQSVVVRVFDDLVAEGPHGGVVSFAVSSEDSGYAAVAIAPRTFSIEDDDLANAAIECGAGPDWIVDGAGRLQVSEDTTAANHDVGCYLQLGTVAAQDVIVEVTTAPGAQLAVDRASVTIPAGEQGPVLVTFTATNDAVAEGPHVASIAFAIATSDPIYAALSIPSVDVDIADDDVVGVIVEPTTPLAIAEGGAKETFTVRLLSQPTSAVTVTLLADAQVVASSRTLEFAPHAWGRPQVVTVTAVDDPLEEPDTHAGIVALSFSSADPAYGAVTAAPVLASIADNDTPGVLLTPTDGGNAVTEGGASDTLAVQLRTQPLSDVTITVGGDSQVGVQPGTLTFTPANWNASQQLTVTAVQDVVTEGEHLGNVTFTLDSGDASYVTVSAATPGAQPVTVADDDPAGVVVVESDGKTAVAEAGGTDTYTIALKAPPTSDVVVTATDDAQVTAQPGTVTFTPANWSEAQTVTVTAVQDSIDEVDPHPGQVLHEVTTTAAGWANADVASVVAGIADDDVAEVVVTQTDDTTKVVEGAAKGDVIRVRLASQPTHEVSILAMGDEQVLVGDEPIVVTPDNWRDPREVVVTAIDDREFEGDHKGAVTFKLSTKDASWAKIDIPAIVVAVGDDDVHSGPNDSTGGEDEEEEGEEKEEEEETDRGPRTSVPPGTSRPGGGDGGDRAATGTRRSEAGSQRIVAGRTRLPAGTAPPKGDDDVLDGRRLSAEVVNATEAEEEAADKPVQDGIFAKVAARAKETWKLWAPLLTVGGAMAGTATYILRSDPVKRAQRGSGNAAGRGPSSRTSQLPERPRKPKTPKKPNRLKGGRKKRKDDEADEAPAARRRPPRR